MNEPVPDELLCTLDLPFPPSVNSYWRNVVIKGRPRTLISEAGRKYRETIIGLPVIHHLRRGRGTPLIHPEAKIAVYILLKMPDRRRRDVDNFLKSMLDSLTHAGVWADDSQIDLLTIKRGELEPPGRALVEVYLLPGLQKVLTIGG